GQTHSHHKPGRTAMKAARKLRRLQHPQSLMEHLRQFLTPQVCKQARQAVPRGRSLPRWDLQPLVTIMLVKLSPQASAECLDLLPVLAVQR
ncbi:MAG: hypothetical protein WB773_28740, partial [Isosphaeraceae bacterium]